MSEKMGAVTSHHPKGLLGLYKGYLYLIFITYKICKFGKTYKLYCALLFPHTKIGAYNASYFNLTDTIFKGVYAYGKYSSVPVFILKYFTHEREIMKNHI